MRFIFILLNCLLFLNSFTFAQPAPKNWMHLGLDQGYYGTHATKAYEELLHNKTPKRIVVAVIDSGIDIDHEDLGDNIWINTKEIPDNGIDDDGNGYIDDVNGWNFIGGPDGSHVDGETLEVTRLYAHYHQKFENVDPLTLTDKEKKVYAFYLKYKREVEREQEKAREALERLEPVISTVIASLEAMSDVFPEGTFTLEDLDEIEPDNQLIMIGKSILQQVTGDTEGDSLVLDEIINMISKELQSEEKYYNTKLNYQYNPDFDSRTSIVKDNYEDSYEKYYGNNDVMGPDARHGTHVAGIIGAIRNNGIGMDGISDFVEIMVIRAVPDGDERDKDVANAIRYAVDNGASIVNMSFGKGYSWDKDVVDDAVKYADKKGVLLVHAAGNSAQNNDIYDNFPNPRYNKTGFFLWPKKEAKNWIEVGAISYQGGEDLVASFSNFGKKTVDIFAPGAGIYSTVPDNQYEFLQGTSMAAPVVSGVAAVLMSYFPELTAKQVKEIILTSNQPIDFQVKVPGSTSLADFSQLCKTGGVINMHNAIIKAMNTKGKKKKVKRTEPIRA